MARPSPQTDRVVAVVELLAAHPERSVTLAEATRRLGINKSTCHSMLTALAAAGWLVRDPFRKTYRLGPALAAVGRVAAAGFPALELARPAIVDLSTALRVNCAVLGVDGDHLTLLDQVRDVRARGAGLGHVGATIPLRAPFGTAVIAWAAPGDVDHWLADVPPDAHGRYRSALAATQGRGFAVELMTTPEPRLREMLAELGDRLPDLVEALAHELAGHDEFLATDIDADREYAVSAVNAPVFDRSGLVLVLSATGFAGRMAGHDLDAVGRRVVATADALTTALHGSRP